MEIVELFKNHLHSPSPLEVDGQSRWWLLSGEPVIPAHLPSLLLSFFFQLCLFSLPSDGKESSFFSVFFFFTFRCVLYLNVAVRFVSVRGKTSHGITEKTSKPNPRARLMVNGLETIYPFRLRARLALPAAERFVFSARARVCTNTCCTEKRSRCKRNFGSVLLNRCSDKKVFMVSHSSEYHFPYLCSVMIAYLWSRSFSNVTYKSIFSYSCHVSSWYLRNVRKKNHFFIFYLLNHFILPQQNLAGERRPFRRCVDAIK